MIRSGLTAIGEDLGGYHRLGDPSCRARGSNNTLGPPALGSNTGKTSSLSWFANQWDLKEGDKKLILHLWRLHTYLDALGNRRPQTETAQGSGLFPRPAV